MRSNKNELLKNIRARLIRNGNGKAIAELQAKLSKSEKQVGVLEAEFAKKRKKCQ